MGLILNIMNQARGKKEGLALLLFKEIKVLINNEYAIFKIGCDDNFVLLSLINKENKYYESKFSLKEFQHVRNEPINKIEIAYLFLCSIIAFEEFNLKYNENKTESIFEINGLKKKNN